MRTEKANTRRKEASMQKKEYAIENQYCKTIEELAQLLHVSTRTIRRYLNTSKDRQEDEYREIRRLYNSGWTQQQIAETEGYSRMQVSRILKQTPDWY